MKFLSINLDPFQPNDSYLSALRKLIESIKPDFIAFQNVTNSDIKKLKKFSGYTAVHPACIYETRLKPAMALLSRYPALSDGPLAPVSIDYDEGDSGMFLQKAYYEMLDKNNKPFVIGIATTVLEKDLRATKVREEQLNQACGSLKHAQDAFLIGNFNLDRDIDGDLVFKGGWADAWLNIPGNTESNGCTYDPDKNSLIKDDEFGARRPDRFFFKSRHFKLDGMEVVGMEPILGIALSKHYGLLARFSPLAGARDRVEQPNVAVQFKRPEWSVNLQEQS